MDKNEVKIIISFQNSIINKNIVERKEYEKIKISIKPIWR